ncbi:hypothetical protein KSD_44040 [Ktedonobacter sp. SOSP1-85]|uniref:tetratricopeptide repeat protein n=1 Tax=Ktedonobacter sp. SOSP1-85 TaxID=2778367 RepID=UPI0019164DAC|nr:tetratricopeptide repeat protein [Ktedonobacter sp. SOSP1-85]GHO76633.1 hypothetical protein KSD_44040 [Ktedonobacter sp. SOSP1-85]
MAKPRVSTTGTSTPYYTPPATSNTGAGKQAQSTPVPGQAVPPTTTPAGPKFVSRVWQQARRTLKGQFIALASGCLLLAILLALVISLSFNRAATDLNTIANGSIPSVDAAQSLAQYIDDIDAKAADYIATAPLTQIEACSVVTASGSKNVGPRRVHDCDQLNIDAEIILANQQLFNAAHNVTYPGERTAVERITAGMEEYIGHLTVMQHEFDQASNTANAQDSHLRNAYQAYLAASSVLHTRIQRQPSIVEDRSTLPACHIGIDQHLAQPNTWVNGGIADNIDCLSDINYTHLQGTTSTGGGYNDVISFLNTALIGAILLSIIFVGWLLISTWRMAAVTHRVINVGLSLSLLVGLIFSLMIIGTLLNFTGLPGTHTASQDGAYRQLVKDDYDSVYYAAKLKRYGTDANADESRWLIALTFNDTTTASGADHWAADWGTNIQQVQQLIANAQNNQTWNEEIQPLSDIHSGWNKYITLDRQIRAAANNGSDPQHINNAEVISTGPSNAAFGTFSDAVTALSKANYDHYNITLSSTQNTLNIYTSLSAILYPLIGLCAAWGIYTRLNEF